MLRSAWEVALEKHRTHEELSGVTRELLDHVTMLEECWAAIRPASEAPAAADDRRRRLAA